MVAIGCALATVASILMVGIARPVADDLVLRRPVRWPPPSAWGALVRTAPRGSVVLAAVLGTSLVARWAVAPVAAVVVLLAAGAATLAAIVDWRCQRLPDVIVVPLGAGLLAAAGGWSAAAGDGRWFAAALVAALAAGGVLGLAWLVGMGLGDVKFGAALGVLVGWAAGTPEAAVLAALGGVGLAAIGASVWWAWGALLGRLATRWFPFGPFLAAAALLLAFLMGPPPATTVPAGHHLADAWADAPSGPSGELVRPAPPGHR